MHQSLDVAREHGAKPFRWAQRIDAGAEIENLVSIQPGPLGQRVQVSAVRHGHRLLCSGQWSEG